ncbi:MAG: phage major capsid protein [Oscillospiraceae bacterium]|nr:phage major capsid protein [Oscillospiraceae bacterium]
MKSKDVIKQDLNEKLGKAMESKDPAALTEAFADFAVKLQSDIVDDFKSYQQTQDSAILARRGVHQLTAAETKFYSDVMGSLKAHFDNPKMAFTGIDSTTLPTTVLDNVLSDIGTTFPLLNVINFQNVSAITKMIVNKQGMQLATWGPINSKIVTELSGAISTINIELNKLTAFMPVSRDMLDVGPEWMDTYVRTVLAEALGYGLSQGIVAGTGKDTPIGMTKDLSAAVDPTKGYQDKTPIVITDLSVKTIGSIAATLAQGPNGRKRPVPSILMVVNPVDYFTLVMPAMTYLTNSGSYVSNVLPYPSQVVQDINVPSGKAIFGLASRYFMGIGKGGSGGQLEYSDEFQFLDDNRVYKIKMYGNGQPLDNNAFVLADITGLTPLKHQVLVVNPTTNPVNTKTVTA